MPSLDFVETTDLVREILRRSDDILIIGCTNRTALEDSLIWSAQGSFHSCLGLLEVGKMLLRKGDEDGSNIID